MVEDIDKTEAQILVRKLDLEAYSSVVTALRAHGDLAEKEKAILEDLREIFSISEERHKAEMRRAANDDHLSMIAAKAMGSVTCENWLAEGRRLLPPLPRVDPQTAFTRLASAASKKHVKTEMAKFFEAKGVLERAIKKQEESRALLLETERIETKRRLAELAPTTEVSVCEDAKSKSNSNTSRKRVRVCSPQPSPSAADDLLVHSETGLGPKPKKSHNSGAKKQRLKMSPSGNNSVQENVPSEDAGSSLPPATLMLSSPVKNTTDTADPISPLATPGQMVRNIDLFAQQTDQHNSVSTGGLSHETVSVEKSNKSPPKSPKPVKAEKKAKQSKKKAAAAAAAAASTSAPVVAPKLEPPKAETPSENATSLSASPPVTLSGVAARSAHPAVNQQQAAQPLSHSQQPAAVVISNAGHGQMVVSSPPTQANVVQASPGKATQSSYHNYAPPLAPLSINPMRLVGRAGAGVAISTAAAASPPSLAVNNLRPQEIASANIPLIRLTPQQPQRPPLILSSGGNRPTAILTPGAPGVPGVLTIRSHRPTLTPVTSSSNNIPVRPSIVIHQAPSTGGSALVMRRIGPAVQASSQMTMSTPVATLPNNRPLIISSSAASGANGSVVVIGKQPLHLQHQPPARPTILAPPVPPATVVMTTSSSNSRNVNTMRDYSYASHFQIASKPVNDLYGADSGMSSPPAVGAESVVETSHDHLTNGNSLDNNTNTRDSSNNSAGLVLLQQAAAAIGDSPIGAELSNFIVDKDLGDHELGNYEDVVETYHHNASGNGNGNPSMTNVASHDAELYNEDLMMAIMNSNSSNGQHRQSQPS